MANLVNRTYQIITATSGLSLNKTASTLDLTSGIQGIGCSKIRSLTVKNNVPGVNQISRLVFAAPESGFVYTLAIRTSHLDSGQVKVYKFRFKSMTTLSTDIAPGLGNAIANSQGYTKFPFEVTGITGSQFDITEKPQGDEVTGEVSIDTTAGAGTSLDISLDREGVNKSGLITFSVTTPHASPIGDPKVLARIETKAGGLSGIRFIGDTLSTATYDVVEVEYKDSWAHGNPVSSIEEGYHVDTLLISNGIAATPRTQIKTVLSSIASELGLSAGGDVADVTVCPPTVTASATVASTCYAGGTYVAPGVASTTDFVTLPAGAKVGTELSISNSVISGATTTLHVQANGGTGLVNGAAAAIIQAGGGAKFRLQTASATPANERWVSI